jgi:hypothetical protein
MVPPLLKYELVIYGLIFLLQLALYLGHHLERISNDCTNNIIVTCLIPPKISEN